MEEDIHYEVSQIGGVVSRDHIDARLDIVALHGLKAATGQS